jgi:DNA-binding FadR family transcriptional regulator
MLHLPCRLVCMLHIQGHSSADTDAAYRTHIVQAIRSVVLIRRLFIRLTGPAFKKGGIVIEAKALSHASAGRNMTIHCRKMPVMKPGIPAKIFDEIRTDIINEVYPIGSRLPPERELSDRHKASRFAVREAIAMLAQNGFVETHPQSGTYVTDFFSNGSLETLVQTLRIRGVIDKQTIDSLLKFRFVTETSAAAEAAVHVTPGDIEYLKTNLSIKKANLANISVLTRYDYDFHYRVVLISGNIINRLVFKSFEPIYSFFTKVFYSLPGAANTALQLKTKFLTALEHKDPLLSHHTMGNILKFGQQKVYEAINEGEQLIV